MTTPTPTIKSRAELKRVAEKLGSYFFAPDTMRFFSSRLEDFKRLDDTSGLIITSEVYGEEPRHYALRSYKVEAATDEAPARLDFESLKHHDGSHMHYSTFDEARRAMHMMTEEA